MYPISTRDPVATLEGVAVAVHGGGLTLLRFGSGWKGCFGTIDLDSYNREAYEWLWAQPAFASLDDLARHLLATGRSYGDER